MVSWFALAIHRYGFPQCPVPSNWLKRATSAANPGNRSARAECRLDSAEQRVGRDRLAQPSERPRLVAALARRRVGKGGGENAADAGAIQNLARSGDPVGLAREADVHDH